MALGQILGDYGGPNSRETTERAENLKPPEAAQKSDSRGSQILIKPRAAAVIFQSIDKYLWSYYVREWGV